MKPIGLMFKLSEVNPFSGRANGDLMVVHECVHCGKISANRISGDDCTHIILNVLEGSLSISDSKRAALLHRGISMLTLVDMYEVKVALYGRR